MRLSDAIEPDRKSLGSLGQNSDGKLSDVEECRNILESYREPGIRRSFDIPRLPIRILS